MRFAVAVMDEYMPESNIRSYYRVLIVESVGKNMLNVIKTWERVTHYELPFIKVQAMSVCVELNGEIISAAE